MEVGGEGRVVTHPLRSRLDAARRGHHPCGGVPVFYFLEPLEVLVDGVLEGNFYLIVLIFRIVAQPLALLLQSFKLTALLLLLLTFQH